MKLHKTVDWANTAHAGAYVTLRKMKTRALGHLLMIPVKRLSTAKLGRVMLAATYKPRLIVVIRHRPKQAMKILNVCHNIRA